MIHMYSKDGCKVCEECVKILEAHDYPYQIFKIGKDVDREFILENFPGMKTVPIIKIGDNFGGSEFLLDYIEMQLIENVL